METFSCISGCHSGIIAGRCNVIRSHRSAIGGGCCNLITATGNCGFIGGGGYNVISGAYSGILGGSGNCDNGFNHVGIFGQNIVASCSGFFYTNNQVMNNMPSSAASVPPGGLYYEVGTCYVKINC